MATEMHPPFSDTVVQVADGSVKDFKAAGWTEAKKATARKSSDK